MWEWKKRREEEKIRHKILVNSCDGENKVAYNAKQYRTI